VPEELGDEPEYTAKMAKGKTKKRKKKKGNSNPQ
jgi:hypothetical protein